MTGVQTCALPIYENLRTGEQKSATAAEKPEQEDSAKETAEKETDEETIVEEERCMDAGDGEEDAPRHHSTAKHPFTEFSSRKYFAHVEHDALYQYTSTKEIKKGRCCSRTRGSGIFLPMPRCCMAFCLTA